MVSEVKQKSWENFEHNIEESNKENLKLFYIETIRKGKQKHIPVILKEVRDTITQLKIGEAPGHDGICPDMDEWAETPQIFTILVIRNAWEDEKIPFDWDVSICTTQQVDTCSVQF